MNDELQNDVVQQETPQDLPVADQMEAETDEQTE